MPPMPPLPPGVRHTPQPALIDRDDSLLAVVDLQPHFFEPRIREDPAYAQAHARAVWVARVAAALGVPAIVTEEDSARNGSTSAEVTAALGGDVPTFDKPVFGLADCEPILAALEGASRGTIALIGFETDVCVAHSAVGLLAAGFRAVVVADACYSPSSAHEWGLRRVADAGAEIVHAKGLYYEWIRNLAVSRDFEATHPELADPPGFSL